MPADTKTSLTAFKCAERLGHDMPSPNEQTEELRLGCQCSVYVYDITTAFYGQRKCSLLARDYPFVWQRHANPHDFCLSSSALSRSLVYDILLVSLPSTFVPVARLKVELFSSLGVGFLKVSFPFVPLASSSRFSPSLSLLPLPPRSLAPSSPPSSSTSTPPGIFPSPARLCSSRYLAHPPRDYRNFLGTTSRCSAFPPFRSFRGADSRKRNPQRISIS